MNKMLLCALRGYGVIEAAASLTPLGQGNINDTYLVADGARKFVLQRINQAVFPKPEAVAANFALVSGHIASASLLRGIEFCCSQPLLTTGGELIHWDDHGSCWRAQSFVEHMPFHNVHFNRASAYQLGRLLAQFHLLTADLDVSRLREPLPAFHITPTYLSRFDIALAEWRGKFPADLLCCLRYVDANRLIAGRLEEAKHSKLLSLTTIHGDPKLDNIIFDISGQARGLFDLDTAGPGLIHYDLGDCLRSSCNRAGETVRKSDQVQFDLNICEAVLNGYLAIAGSTLSHWDRYYIYDSIRVITFELGVRFLTDYLCGNVYFKVMSPKENLYRALGQFQLLESIVAQEFEIQDIVGQLG